MATIARKKLIVISDDEDSESSDSSESSTVLLRTRSHVTSRNVPNSSQIRANKNPSPILNRVSKRPKLDHTAGRTCNRPRNSSSSDDDLSTDSADSDADLNDIQRIRPPWKSIRHRPSKDDPSQKPVLRTKESSDDAPNPSPSTGQAKPRAPYFYDPDFKIRMYRGPGHEQFPVPLELSDEHKRICQEWMKTLKVSSRLISSRNSPSDIDEIDDNNHQIVTLSPAEQKCIQNVYDVMPDIDYEFVKNKVHEKYEIFRFGNEEIEVLPNIDELVAGILEQGDYPRRKAVAETRYAHFEEETGQTIEWNKNHTTHHHYLVDAVKLLAEHFGDVPVDFIHKVMTEKRSLWDTFLHINDIDLNYFQLPKKPYDRSRLPRTMVEKIYNRGADLMLDRRYYACLVNELQAAKQHAARQFLEQIRQLRHDDDEKQNVENNRIEGGLLECQCCFDEEMPLNRSVACTGPEVHLFCYICVRGLADSQIGLMKYEMLCMDSSGCQATLDTGGIARAVPAKSFERLEYNQQQAEITAAAIEGLEQCPMCDFKAICDPIEFDIIFSCQNPECLKVTCRKCQQSSHLPKSCEEVEKDKSLNVRHKIEEARSQAMIRSCPKCNAKIVKESGCNKMRCTCGTILCYVCKVELSDRQGGYEHFNNPGSKCKLYDTPGIERHTLDADEAEDKAVAEAKALDPTVEESSLRIESRQTPKSIPDPRPIRQVRPWLHPRRNRSNPGFLFDEEPRLAGEPVNDDAGPPIIMPPRPFDFNPLILNRPHRNRRAEDPLVGDNFGNNLIHDQRLVEAQERDNNWRDLGTAARIQNFRNDLARRRQSQTRRGSQTGDDKNHEKNLRTAHFEFNRSQQALRQRDGDIVMTDVPDIMDQARNRQPLWRTGLENGPPLTKDRPAVQQPRVPPLWNLPYPQPPLPREQRPLPQGAQPSALPGLRPSNLPSLQPPNLPGLQRPAVLGLPQPVSTRVQQLALPRKQQPMLNNLQQAAVPRTYEPQAFPLARNVNNNNNTNFPYQPPGLHNNRRRNVLIQGFDFENARGTARGDEKVGVPWHRLE